MAEAPIVSRNDFQRAVSVEQRGLRDLEPYLASVSRDGRYVIIGYGHHAAELQQRYGDILLNTNASRVIAVELKVEERHTGNLFIETWSNKDFDRRRRGWLDHSHADELWYYFLDVQTLYVLDLRQLWAWAEGRPGEEGALGRFREVTQRRYDQLNVTCGRLVPVEVLQREVGIRVAYPTQEGS